MRVAILPLGPRPSAVGSPQLTPPLRGVLAELEPGEPLDLHLLPRLRADLVEVLLDRLAVVLHEGLIEEHVVLQERLDLALHDPRHDAVRLARLTSLHLGDLLLRLQDRGRNVVPGDPARCGRARDVQREVLHELPELLGVGDEVGLAVDLDERPNGVVEVDVRVDPALVGASPGALGRAREPLLAQELRCARDVAVGLDQRALAVHHPGAGRVAELLNHRGVDIGHQDPSPTGAEGSAGAEASAGAEGSAGAEASAGAEGSAGAEASAGSSLAPGSAGIPSATISSPSASEDGTSGSNTVLAAIAAASSADGVSSTAAGAACGRAPLARGARAATFSATSSLAIP